MPRTHISLSTIRNPVKRSRAEELKNKLDDHDDALDALEGLGLNSALLVKEYDAADAIDPLADIVFIDATTAGMAMTLADATIPGETITIVLRSKSDSGDSAVITPNTFDSGATITLDDVGEQVQLIWVDTNGWTARRSTGTIA